MTPAEWHAEAMELADNIARAYEAKDHARSQASFAVRQDAWLQARAALSLHLLAYPVGEPVAYMRAPGRQSILRDVTLQKFLRDDVPLYRNPKESA